MPFPSSNRLDQLVGLNVVEVATRGCDRGVAELALNEIHGDAFARELGGMRVA